MERGAFVIMHSEIDEEGIASGITVFGTDDAPGFSQGMTMTISDGSLSPG
jgi:hypothetical protein